ncbi:HEPN domain-containing protein [Amycolatopsis rifamycinica]|uniref:HEPN domain-containing protein n=1 Tax=Amycolatopsis rifamycinica TaxID=287986 RepID=UPI0038994BD7
MVGPSLECDDLLRSAVVFAISALDYYIHDLVLECLVDVFRGNRNRAKGFELLQLPASFSYDLSATSSPYEKELLYRQTISESLSRKTYQRADDIASGLKLICDTPFWSGTYGRGSTCESAKRELNLIATRRNKIVHEADLADSTLGEKWPIDNAMVTEAMDHISHVSSNINQFAENV